MKVKTIYNSDYVNLINILSNERKRLGISQKEVAFQLSISQTDISKIERLERRLDILELKNLLKIYRISSNPNLKKVILEFLEI
ncbi:helix-turn-helix domain-containing protein [Acinetobacter baumannii]|uniref:helix-turn-helix domain-containing protein n=1 Tax=Acinetobacter baumannii TaxID=470 RepID=UPI000F7475F4|nr:helix-turn-helix transcriptional regulator [Acinetobacter baumannii]RSP97788.1 XRE family transcriptional regulator [Acinetobacter baumannii]